MSSRGRPDHGLRRVPITSYTGFEWCGQSVVPHIRRGYCVIGDVSIGGAAPKDFVRIYEYGSGRKNQSKSWPAFIAKIGHKWYPGESITEHLMTRVGECLGLCMAESRLMLAAGQLRFLSRYFLQEDENLVHGAQIFSSYLEDDEFVTEVDQQKQTRNVFTFQVICEAVRTRFPRYGDIILEHYVRMLAFDALVGNNDRHIYNWAVIVDIRGRRPPRFSPIYDTARGLFWNEPEKRLSKFRDQHKLARYVDGSKPQVGWDGVTHDINHFELLERICRNYPKFCPVLLALGTRDALNAACGAIEDEFGRLLSARRRQLIKECLELRFSRYTETVRESCGKR